MALAVTERLAPALLGAGAPAATALVDGDDIVSYEDLAGRVDRRQNELALAPRSLVVLKATNSVEFVATYLALLAGDHVPLLADEHADRLAGTWDADAVVGVAGGELHVDRSAVTARRALHPDLALLLSTSGSTGAPKLVRLSHDNLLSNARSIASYLGLTAADRGIMSLPLHYCYGLSVLHSHLIAGGSVVTTTASVVDPCFSVAMQRHEVTNVAGVPHTFELLERVGPEVLHVPSLRFVTQAGGRLRPERLHEWAERSQRWGIDFYVMYGQTEATARMAYLPPELLGRHPEAIGRPIPGGHLEVRPVEGQADDVGELVYRGPNVMLGYATSQSDLASGATLEELATGDLARLDAADGVYEIVGRRSRFVKPFGLRIDLDAIETDLADAGIDAAVTGDDEHLVVCAPHAPADTVRRRIAGLTGLPLSTIQVDPSATIPRTSSGKVDYERIRSKPEQPVSDEERPSVAAIFTSILGRHDVSTASTFVALGGDSLSYVECSVRLEQLLGHLPDDWHLTTVAELDAFTRHGGPRRLDTTAVLRTAGIAAIVATHMSLWYFPGGSHLMLAVVGYNMSRFHLSLEHPRDRIRAAMRTVGRVALPVVGWVGICMLLVGGYSLPTLALVNNYVGPSTHGDGRWHYWFIEALVQLLVLTVLTLGIPPVRRFERRFPYLFSLLVFAGALAFRYHWVIIDGLGNLRFRTHGVAWFFLLGWLAHGSTSPGRRLVTTMLCVLTIPGFFERPEREWFVAVGIIVLVWWRELPLPGAAIRPIAVVAAASMWIFVSHFRIWPPLERNLPTVVAYALTILAGVAIWRGSTVVAHVGRRAAAATAGRRRSLDWFRGRPAVSRPTRSPEHAAATVP